VDHIVHVGELLSIPTEHAPKANHAKCTGACQKVGLCKIDIERMAFTPRNIWPVWYWIGLNLKTFRTSEVSLALLVSIEWLLNSTITLQCRCMPLAPLWTEYVTLGDEYNVESRGKLYTLHSLGTENASMVSTPSNQLYPVLQFLLYWTPKPNITSILIPANMQSTWCSAWYNSQKNMYCVKPVLNCTMWRHDTQHTTENYWVSGTKYFTG